MSIVIEYFIANIGWLNVKHQKQWTVKDLAPNTFEPQQHCDRPTQALRSRQRQALMELDAALG